jgi:Uma2 family endonuclease
MSTTTTRLFTADELFRLPENDRRYELIEGVLTKMPPTGFEHGDVTMNVAFLLKKHVTAHRLGKVLAAEVGFKLASDPDTVLAPDVSFIRQEEIDRLGPTKKFWPGAPDLAVEVMSPGDTVRAMQEKARLWLAHGARLVWVVNPARRTVSVHKPGAEAALLKEGDALEGQGVVQGFRCRVSEIFG